MKRYRVLWARTDWMFAAVVTTDVLVDVGVYCRNWRWVNRAHLRKVTSL